MNEPSPHEIRAASHAWMDGRDEGDDFWHRMRRALIAAAEQRERERQAT